MNKNDKDIGKAIGQLEIVLAKLDSIEEKIEGLGKRVNALEQFKSYFIGITVAVIGVTEVFLKFIGK